MIGSFVLGAMQGRNIVPVCNVGSGMTMEKRRELAASLEPYRTDSRDSGGDWDYSPGVVWEVRFADLTIRNTKSDDILPSLRFPVFLRQRLDKDVSEATTINTLVEWFENQ